MFSDTRPEVAGTYTARGGDDVPAGFARVCSQHGWDEARTWGELNGGEGGRWYKHEQHDGYIYHNKSDGEWWIDGPDGCVRGPFECSQWRAAMTALDRLGWAKQQPRHPYAYSWPAGVRTIGHNSHRTRPSAVESWADLWAVGASTTLQVGGLQGPRPRLCSHGHVHSVEGAGRGHAHAGSRRLPRMMIESACMMEGAVSSGSHVRSVQ